MLGLTQRLTVQQALNLKLCQELKLTGGSTITIFPEVEALLAITDYQKALDLVAKKKNAYKYRSVMDFLFCELYPHRRPACFRYYLSGKLPFREIITMAQRQVYAWELCRALAVAYQAFCEKRTLSWTAFREEVQLAIA